MNNRNIVNIFRSTLILFFFLLLIGCSENQELINNPTDDYSVSGDYYVLGIEDAMSSIEDATLENDMGFGNNFGSKDFPPKGGFRPRGHGHHGGFNGGFKGKGLHLGKIFYQLDLSEDQRGTLKTLMVGNRECLTEPFEQFREAAKEIMERKKEQLKAIRDEVKAGNLTRIEAHEELKLINEAVREEIENCEACIEAREAICACNTALFESIGTDLNLTDEQLEEWNDWLSEHPRPCSDG